MSMWIQTYATAVFSRSQRSPFHSKHPILPSLISFSTPQVTLHLLWRWYWRQLPSGCLQIQIYIRNISNLWWYFQWLNITISCKQKKRMFSYFPLTFTGCTFPQVGALCLAVCLFPVGIALCYLLKVLTHCSWHWWCFNIQSNVAGEIYFWANVANIEEEIFFEYLTTIPEMSIWKYI